MRKNLDPNLKPERKQTLPKQGSMERPRVGQGRDGSKRKKLDPINHAINQASNLSQKIPGRTEIETSKTNHVHTKDVIHSINNANDRMANSNPLIPDGTFHPGPVYRAPPKPIKQNMTHAQGSQSSNIDNNNSDLNLILKKIPHFKKALCLKHFKDQTNHFFQEPKELGDLINKGNFIHKYLPKQTDIDRILEIIQRKVLKGTHLPVKIKEIQAGYIHSPYFKDLYLYLSQNKLPSSKLVTRRIETSAEKYVLLDSLLFQISSDKETAVLAVPELCADKIITLYHKSLFAGHQGVIKIYLTINDKFFIPNLIHYLRSYIKGCHLCQLVHNKKPPPRQFQARINPNYVLMSRLSMDLKVKPRSHKGQKYILCIIDEVTNYLITVPIFQARSEEIGEALIENGITKYCIPEYIIMEQDSMFMSSLMTYLLHKFNIKIKTVAPYNHQSLQSEHGIKSPAHISTKHLTNLGQMWPKYLLLAVFAYNTFNTPNLGNYSLYVLTFW